MRTTILAAIMLAVPSAAAEQDRAAKRPVRSTPSVLAKAKASITAGLKDAPSARFRNLRQAPDADRQRVCGEVNAKNSYGGYVGFQKFVYFVDTDESEILDEDFGSVTYVREQAKKFGSCF